MTKIIENGVPLNHIDTLLLPRWLIPIEPHNVYMEDYAVAIDQGHIVDVLPQRKATQQYQAKNTVQLENHALMPGLVNMHTHSPMTLFRGMADDLALMDWLHNHIWPAEKKWLGDEFCYDGTRLAILEMLRSGTTCFNENFFFCGGIGKAVNEMGMRACLGITVIDFETNQAKTPEEYFTVAEKIYQQWQNHPLITYAIAPQGPYSCSDATFQRVKEFSEKYNIPIHLHLHETNDEIQQSLQNYNKRAIKRMFELGILTPRTQCIHMTQINDEDMEILRQVKPNIVHCPTSNLKLASGFAPITKFLEAKLNVSIGTDGAASNNDLDMFGEIQLASLLGKAVSKNPTALNAAMALRMATLNGAKAMNLDHEIGTIAIGKAADLIAVDLSALNTQPIYNPISHLVYAINSRQVSDVWVAGKQLLKNGDFPDFDTKAILAIANEWKNKILN